MPRSFLIKKRAKMIAVDRPAKRVRTENLERGWTTSPPSQSLTGTAADSDVRWVQGDVNQPPITPLAESTDDVTTSRPRWNNDMTSCDDGAAANDVTDSCEEEERGNAVVMSLGTAKVDKNASSAPTGEGVADTVAIPRLMPDPERDVIISNIRDTSAQRDVISRLCVIPRDDAVSLRDVSCNTDVMLSRAIITRDDIITQSDCILRNGCTYFIKPNLNDSITEYEASQTLVEHGIIDGNHRCFDNQESMSRMGIYSSASDALRQYSGEVFRSSVNDRPLEDVIASRVEPKVEAKTFAVLNVRDEVRQQFSRDPPPYDASLRPNSTMQINPYLEQNFHLSQAAWMLHAPEELKPRSLLRSNPGDWHPSFSSFSPNLPHKTFLVRSDISCPSRIVPSPHSLSSARSHSPHSSQYSTSSRSSANSPLESILLPLGTDAALYNYLQQCNQRVSTLHSDFSIPAILGRGTCSSHVGHSVNFGAVIDPESFALNSGFVNQSVSMASNKSFTSSRLNYVTGLDERFSSSKISSASQPTKDISFDVLRKDNYSLQDIVSSTGQQKVRSFGCNSCGRSYATALGLSKHRSIHCPGSKTPDGGTKLASLIPPRHACPHCARSYTTLGALRMHVRTHTLPCACTLCGKAFARPWLLQGHMRTHSGERPYRCKHCERAFADRSNLRAHEETHAVVKRYACAVCERTFTRASLLSKHRKIAACGASTVLD